jgi:hypothetical protein
METLARFRPDPAVLAGLKEIDDVGQAETALGPGELPRSWLDKRRVGEATLRGDFADVGHSTWLGWLRSEMAARLVHYKIHELDAGLIRLSAPRGLTQEISGLVHDQTEGGGRRYAEVAYLSRLGDEFQNWATFEPAQLEPRIPQNIRDTDVDFLEALDRLGLTLVER